MTDLATRIEQATGPDRERVEAVLALFNGGLVECPDPSNPRGFTLRYLPIEAMKRALFSVSQSIRIGDLTLSEGYGGSSSIAITQASGEAGDFPVHAVENALQLFYKANF